MTAKGNLNLDFLYLSFFVVITDKSHQKGIKILNGYISGKYLIFIHYFFKLRATYMMMHWNLRNPGKVVWVQILILTLSDSPHYLDWLWRNFFPVVKWLECEAGHSSSFSGEGMNM
jgi:hypothetical protein